MHAAETECLFSDCLSAGRPFRIGFHTFCVQAGHLPPWGPGAETMSVAVWPGGGGERHHSQGLPGSGPPRPVLARTLGTSGLHGHTSQASGANQVGPSFSSPKAALSTYCEPVPRPGSGVEGQDLLRARHGAHRLADGFQRGRGKAGFRMVR